MSHQSEILKRNLKIEQKAFAVVDQTQDLIWEIR